MPEDSVPELVEEPGAPTGSAIVSFGERLVRVFDSVGQLCVGIDPHAYLLGEWGLPDDARGLRDFGRRVVDAAAGIVGIVKPQVAFFERHGAAGYSALEAVLSAARDAGLLVIADVKRGDLGTSVEAYGQAWLTPDGPLEVDAMTASAYQGVGSLAAPLELAAVTGKGVFVLAATSNPESRVIQTALLADGRSVASSIVGDVVQWNSARGDGVGSVGLVMGATARFADYGIDLESLVNTPILAPGFGHQGAAYADLRTIYGPAAGMAVVSSSRGVLAAGPSGIAEAIATQAREVLECRE
ncbi:MAG: orotidine-5'-phosphate decarboxylase [Actinomycetota bacterium]